MREIKVVGSRNQKKWQLDASAQFEPNILPSHREPSKLLIPIMDTITKYTSRTDR
uniref:Uncharacterized protein n=1 Tax=Oryza punctata TaxID=4537 RepID=A0A0E0LAU6_ORYPU